MFNQAYIMSTSYPSSPSHPPASPASIYIYKGTEDVPKTVTHVLIHNSLTEIERYAFQNCFQLQSVTIQPNTITKISRSAFGHCASLSTITIPTGVTYIGENAFRDCYNLEKVNLACTVTHIGIGSFRCCKKLKLLNIPWSVEKICVAAFYHCEGLVSVCIQEQTDNCTINYNTKNEHSIKAPTLQIYPAAFRGCKNLINIVLPKYTTFVTKNSGFDSKQYSYFSQCDIIESHETNTIITTSNNNKSNHRLQEDLLSFDTDSSNINNNNNSDIHTLHWLQHRFDNLPLHQACYYHYDHHHYNHQQNPFTIENVIQIMEKNTRKNTIEATDELGLTVLHILVCYYQEQEETWNCELIIKYLIELYPYLLHMTTAMTNMTPLDLFYYCHNVIQIPETQQKQQLQISVPYNKKKRIITLMDALNEGLEWNIIHGMLLLDPSALLELDNGKGDGNHGLVPFLFAASDLVDADLDVVYGLTRFSVETLVVLTQNKLLLFLQ